MNYNIENTTENKNKIKTFRNKIASFCKVLN